jgi:hypothetical protein
MSSHIDEAVFFDYERWSVGLLIHYAKPQMVKWELRTILVQMSMALYSIPSRPY